MIKLEAKDTIKLETTVSFQIKAARVTALVPITPAAVVVMILGLLVAAVTQELPAEAVSLVLLVVAAAAAAADRQNIGYARRK